MIYVDSSVALALLLEESRRPSDGFWVERLYASRLMQYEVWNRLHRYGVAAESTELTHALFARVSFIELTSNALARALEPFPVPLRTLDALHLATMTHLRELGREVTLASYDARMIAAARSLDFEIAEL